MFTPAVAAHSLRAVPPTMACSSVASVMDEELSRIIRFLKSAWEIGRVDNVMASSPATSKVMFGVSYGVMESSVDRGHRRRT